MKEFIDKTIEQNGTAINRESMMAIQGFQAKTTTIHALGQRIDEVDDYGHTLTTKITTSEIIETFTGEKTITKTTTFDYVNNKILEVIS